MFGAAFKELRHRHDLARRHLADRVDMHRSHLADRADMHRSHLAELGTGAPPDGVLHRIRQRLRHWR